MSDDVPQWLQEIGRRAAAHDSGRPVPHIPHGLARAKELDEAAALRLEQDYRVVLDTCTEDDEPQLNAQILDAMTANRLSSKQAYVLLSALFRKFSGSQGISRIDAEGNAQPLNRWGAA